MNHKVITLPFIQVRQHFQTYGFTNDEITSIMTTLVMIWRSNELVEDITREYVFTELDLDELTAQALWSAVSIELVGLANTIRTLAVCGQLIRWVVHPFTLLLEVQNEANYP